MQGSLPENANSCSGPTSPEGVPVCRVQLGADFVWSRGRLTALQMHWPYTIQVACDRRAAQAVVVWRPAVARASEVLHWEKIWPGVARQAGGRPVSIRWSRGCRSPGVPLGSSDPRGMRGGLLPGCQRVLWAISSPGDPFRTARPGSGKRMCFREAKLHICHIGLLWSGPPASYGRASGFNSCGVRACGDVYSKGNVNRGCGCRSGSPRSRPCAVPGRSSDIFSGGVCACGTMLSGWWDTLLQQSCGPSPGRAAV